MKSLISYLLPFCLFSLNLGAQSLNSPESMLWDYQTRKFLISNAADGSIQCVNDAGKITPFSKASKGSHGLCFYGLYSVVSLYKNEVYVSDRLTGTLIRKHQIPGAVFLNGVCSDGKNTIYVTDFSQRKIFRLENLDAANCKIELLSSLDKVPNGVAYDKVEQNLVVLTWGNRASILHVSISTGLVVKQIATNYSNLEGILNDGDTGFYVTSWVPGGLFHYDGLALEPMVTQGMEQTTGLAKNGRSQLFLLNSLDKNFKNSPIEVESWKSNLDDETILLTAFPNPMSINSLITYELPETGPVSISVYDCQGNLIEQLVTERKSAGKHQFFYDRGSKSSGLYFINIQSASGNKAIAVTLVD